MANDNDLISVVDLAAALKIDRSNLKKLAYKLGIEQKRIRGKNNQWTQAFSGEDVETILGSRKGIPNNLVKIKGTYYLEKK